MLLAQWAGEFSIICPGLFDLYLYYGGKRSARESATPGMRQLDTLTKDHPLFDGRESNAKAIILTAYATLAERNGPEAQKAWRMKTRGYTKYQADKAEEELDLTWPGSLRGCFRIMVGDEAHAIKVNSTKAAVTILWIVSAFKVFATATPIPNGIED